MWFLSPKWIVKITSGESFLAIDDERFLRQFSGCGTRYAYFCGLVYLKCASSVEVVDVNRTMPIIVVIVVILIIGARYVYAFLIVI